MKRIGGCTISRQVTGSCLSGWFALTVVLLLLASIIPKAEARIYTERGKRYYRVFGADFTLTDGQLDDQQARKIQRFTENCYDKNIVNDDLRDVWRNIDDIYEGGKYHGLIVLTILRTYLNSAFAKYHNDGIGFRGNLRRFSSGEGDIVANYAQASTRSKFYSHTTLGSTGKEKYIISWETCYRILPDFFKMSSSLYTRGSQKEFCHNSRDAKVYAEKFVTRNMIYMSAYVSSQNIENVLTHIDRTIREDDSIFVKGDWDKVMLQILDQFSVTREKFGDKISKTFYKKVAVTVFSYIRKDEARAAFEAKARELGLEARFAPKGDKKHF